MLSSGVLNGVSPGSSHHGIDNASHQRTMMKLNRRILSWDEASGSILYFPNDDDRELYGSMLLRRPTLLAGLED